MSLDAALLSLIPGVRKLRHLRAPKMPAAGSISPEFSRYQNQQDWLTGIYDVPVFFPLKYETHGLNLPTSDSTTPETFEVCNLSGPGAINGLWLVSCGESYTYYNHDVGVSCVIDGVEIIDQSWTFEQLNIPTGEINPGNNDLAYLMIPFIGTARKTMERRMYGDSFQNFPVMRNEVQQAPFPFKNSLVVSIVQKRGETYTSALTAKRYGSRLSVSAWQTE